jgi:hypothetical protein
MFENYVNKKQMKKIEDKYKEDLEWIHIWSMDCIRMGI